MIKKCLLVVVNDEKSKLFAGLRYSLVLTYLIVCFCRVYSAWLAIYEF